MKSIYKNVDSQHAASTKHGTHKHGKVDV
eukprot:COSAG02_NODE_70139_length_197_cov_32.561224_1_plen_28_part_01